MVKVKKENVITLPALATGTWLDHTETGHLVGDDASGRAYAQFRLVLGSIMSAAEANNAKALAAQIPYNFEKLVGDIQGLDKAQQAVMAGTAFLRSIVPDKFEFIATRGLVEVSRRYGPDPFGPLFEMRWKTA